MRPADRLIAALDHPTLGDALAQVDRLGDVVERYKVGLELYLSAGARALSELRTRGKRVFLDLKLHDIPETVGRAARVAASQGADSMTIHSAGGKTMMQRAVEGARAGGDIKVLAVTVLTSLDVSDLVADGNPSQVEELVVRRARLAEESGCDGVIASPREAAAIRKAVAADFIIVTPGVRPGATTSDDQKRVATARDALAAGADAVVVGRPIRDAADPIAVVNALLAELA
jgi:orotidine-5'-phosphate decarboxylase